MDNELHPPASLADALEDQLKQVEGIFDELDGVLDQIFQTLGVSDRELEELLAPKERPKVIIDPEEVEKILKGAEITGNQLRLTCGQIAPELYARVDQVLVSLGGNWESGAIAAHVFEKTDPQEVLAQYLADGTTPNLNPLSFYATKPSAAFALVARIRPENAYFCLDADAGRGALARAFKHQYPNATLHLVEIDPERAEACRQLKLGQVFERDFLTFRGYTYPAILINPPFTAEGSPHLYAEHIEHAFSLLRIGGQLIGIAPPGYTFNKDKKSSQFKAFVERWGSYEMLSPESCVGTQIKATVCILEKK
jgi:predicted RNA methylase